MAQASRKRSMQPIVSISNLSKTYASGHHALKNLSLDIAPGEILALLGPNGAGKTTLISIICGIVNASSGSVTVDGHDIIADYRTTRSLIGLVPQELTLGSFEKVMNTLSFSRGLFGKKPDPAYLEQLLKNLSLWDKRNSEVMALSVAAVDFHRKNLRKKFGLSRSGSNLRAHLLSLR